MFYDSGISRVSSFNPLAASHNTCRLICRLLVILKVIFANSVDPDQTDQGPHYLPVYKNRLESLQEYSADDINRQHFHMQVVLALYGLSLFFFFYQV